MELFLGYETSDALLEKLARTGFEGVWRTYECPAGGKVDWEAVHLIGQALGKQTVDLVVPGSVHRARSQFATYRVWGGRFPREPYITDGSGIMVASPEFTLILAASELSDLQLAQMVMRYLGLYTPNKMSVDGFDKRMPLTSVDRVEAMLAQVGGAQGVDKLRRALRRSIECSRSPMETNLALVLTLPKTSNGYGLPKPEMNKFIPLEGLAREIVGKPYCYGDLVWGDCVTEFQGRRHNDTIGDDLTRALALELMGYKVHFVAFEQFADSRQLDVVARRIARDIHHRIHEECWPQPEAIQEVIDLLLMN